MQVTHGTAAADDAQNAGVDDKPVAVDASKNLLKNGGFEDGLTGWTPNSNLTYKHLTGGQGHESDSALMIHDGTNRWGRMQQDFPVEEGKIYRVTFSYRDMNQKGDSAMSVQFSNDGVNYDADTAFTVPFGSGDTAWHTVDVTFTSTSYTYARIRFIPNVGEGTEKHIDNVHVELVGDDTNLIDNSYFSKGEESWKISLSDGGVCKIEAGLGPDGSTAVLLSGENSYSVELSTGILPVEKHTNYVLTYRLQSLTGLSVGAFIKGGTSATSANKSISDAWHRTEAAAWETKTIRFNSKEYDYVRVCFSNADAGEVYYIDDVVLTQETSKPIYHYVTSYQPTDLVGKIDAQNLITDNGFEQGDGNWNVTTLVDGAAVKVVQDAAIAHSGTAYLQFAGKSATEKTTAVFYVDVEAYTEYTFSAWMRSVGMGKDNDGSVTIGIIDPETGDYFVSDPLTTGAGPMLDFTTERALVPTAFDDAWHLRGMTFKTEGMTRIGIAINGYHTQLYLDDMTLCKSSEATKYVAEENAYSIQLKMYDGEMGCAVEDNLLRNYNFEGRNLSFWSDVQGYDRFVQVADASQWGGDKALKYSGSADSLGNLYVKWVTIEPNTDYVMTFSFKVTQDGDGSFGLMDGKLVNPHMFAEIAFSTALFEDVEEDWLTMAFSFHSGVHNRVGLVIGDFGGEAYLDNLRLFEKSKAAPLVNDNVANPADDILDGEDASAATDKKDDKPTVWLWIVPSVGGVLLIGGITAYLLWRKKKSAATTEE